MRTKEHTCTLVRRSPCFLPTGSEEIAATQMEQRLTELLMQLPQAVQITQQGTTYLWRCAKGQGSASTFLEATQQALTTLLRGTPSPGEEQVAAPGGAQGRRML